MRATPRACNSFEYNVHISILNGTSRAISVGINRQSVGEVSVYRWESIWVRTVTLHIGAQVSSASVLRLVFKELAPAAAEQVGFARGR